MKPWRHVTEDGKVLRCNGKISVCAPCYAERHGKASQIDFEAKQRQAPVPTAWEAMAWENKGVTRGENWKR